jgi:hypothetical protein
VSVKKFEKGKLYVKNLHVRGEELLRVPVFIVSVRFVQPTSFGDSWCCKLLLADGTIKNTYLSTMDWNAVS